MFDPPLLVHVEILSSGEFVSQEMSRNIVVQRKTDAWQAHGCDGVTVCVIGGTHVLQHVFLMLREFPKFPYVLLKDPLK